MKIDAEKINTRQGHCLINDEICYVFIPKVASLTTAWAFAEFCGGRHANFIDTPEILEDRRIAVLLRNPVDRFISAYNYPGWVTTPGAVPHPRECLTLQDGHFAPQSWYVGSVEADIEIVEDITNWDGFATQIGLTPPIPRKNIQFADRFEQHRTEELIAEIENNYEEDFALRARLLRRT